MNNPGWQTRSLKSADTSKKSSGKNSWSG